MTNNLTYDELMNECENLQKQVSAYKDALNALRGSEERHRTILDTMGEGYMELDLSGKFTFVNDAEAKMLGYSSKELLGLSYHQYTSKQTSMILYEVFHRVYRTGEPAQLIDYEVIMKNGSKRIHEMSTTLIRDDSGRPVGFRGVTRDVTERKQADEALKKSEAKYRFLTEKINDIIWTTDLDFNVTYISPSVYKVVGFTPEECMRMTPSEAITPKSFDKVIEIMSLELSREQEEGINPERTVKFEMEDYHKNGSTVWVECVVSGIRDDSGKLVGFYGVSRDISERKKSTLEKDQLIVELQGALADVKRLKGMLPICACCKKIRDDKGYWNQIESYISAHSDTVFSHSICPECAKKLYPDLID